MKYLVTGGGGFLGNVLCLQILNDGHEVVCMDNFFKGHCDAIIPLTENRNFQFLEGDIAQFDHCYEAVEGVDAIVNLAAIVGFPMCKKYPVLAEATNIQGVKNLLKARDLVCGDATFITASTDSVYGSNSDTCTEETVPNPVSLYGETKLEAEYITLSHENTLVIRYATGMGVSPCMRVNLLVNDFVEQALSNNVLTIFQPDMQRAFVNVKDMGRAMLYFTNLLKRNKNTYDVYNIGDDRLNWTKRQLAEYVKERTGCFVDYIDFAEDSDCRNYVISHDRMTEDGFKCGYSMEETLDELIKTMPVLKSESKYQ